MITFYTIFLILIIISVLFIVRKIVISFKEIHRADLEDEYFENYINYVKRKGIHNMS